MSEKEKEPEPIIDEDFQEWMDKVDNDTKAFEDDFSRSRIKKLLVQVKKNFDNLRKARVKRINFDHFKGPMSGLSIRDNIEQFALSEILHTEIIYNVEKKVRAARTREEIYQCRVDLIEISESLIQRTRSDLEDRVQLSMDKRVIKSTKKKKKRKFSEVISLEDPE